MGSHSFYLHRRRPDASGRTVHGSFQITGEADFSRLIQCRNAGTRKISAAIQAMGLAKQAAG